MNIEQVLLQFAKRPRRKLNLPLFPTTTISSFPQTTSVRSWRAKYKSGDLSPAEYDALIEKETEDAFLISASGVADDKQIHTHMCYSEFNDIIQNIADMDADVITIECSRSQMELLDAFADFKYPNEIGPGVYDIHSPRVPCKEEMVFLLEKAKSVIPAGQLWVNPDCGLKSRHWDESKKALVEMVAAAKVLRESVEEAVTL